MGQCSCPTHLKLKICSAIIEIGIGEERTKQIYNWMATARLVHEFVPWPKHPEAGKRIEKL